MDQAVHAHSDLSSRIDVTIGVVFPYFLGCVVGTLIAPVAALRLWPMWCTALSGVALFLYLSSIWWMGNHAFRLYPRLEDHLEVALYASGAAVLTALAGTVLAEVCPRFTLSQPSAGPPP